MDYYGLMKARHSVRQYTEDKIEGEALRVLTEALLEAEKQSGLHFELILNEPEAFDCMLARKLGFKNANNYIAVTGEKNTKNEIKAGYFGADVVLKSQEAGLNTCFVAGTYSRRKVHYTKRKNEKLLILIAVGYGENHGTPHINCSIDKLCDFRGDMPPWFLRGMDYAMLAPTAMNDQKFCFILRNENEVKLVSRGGTAKGVTLGIVKYHFEKGAGTENFAFTD